MQTGIGSWVSYWGALQPDKPLIEFEDVTITWGEFDDRVSRLARGLRALGVGKGDRVGLLMNNRPEFLLGFFAIQRLGAMAVSLNVRYSARELRYVVADAEPRVVLTEGSFAGLVAEVAPEVDVRHWVSADEAVLPGGQTLDDLPAGDDEDWPEISFGDPAAILYTSGTTGMPKGAVITHGNIHFGTLNWLLDIGLGKHDRHLVAMPLCFTGGLISACMNAFHGGATIVLEREFDPGRLLEVIQRERITWMIAVPTMLRMLADHPAFADADLSSVRGMLSGGSPVPVPMIQVYQRKGIGFVQGFGITEGSGGINLYLPPEEGERKVGSTGKSALYGRVRLVDEAGNEPKPGEVGELLIGGPLVFKEYWKNPQATADTVRDGWLHTGDLATRDEDGYYYIVDRKKDMIISGGLNVYPAEIEPVIQAVEGVTDAAVVGLPDDRWGEAVTAFAVCGEGAAVTAEDIIEHCRRELSDYKVPKRVEFVPALPMTVSGKVQKRVLREQFS